MKGQFVFIGSTRNGLGYINGEMYDLTITRDPGGRYIIRGPIVCPYDSAEAFYKNWQHVAEPAAKLKADFEKDNPGTYVTRAAVAAARRRLASKAFVVQVSDVGTRCVALKDIEKELAIEELKQK